jgi:hypothetical protein
VGTDADMRIGSKRSGMDVEQLVASAVRPLSCALGKLTVGKALLIGLIGSISAARGQALDPFYLTDSVRDGAVIRVDVDPRVVSGTNSPARRRTIPAEDLPEFNAHIVGLIEVIETFGAK